MTFSITAPPPGWTPAQPPTILDAHSFPGYEAKLIHLLLGSTSLLHVPTGEKIAQSINWAVLGTAAGKKTEKAFKAALAAQTFGIAEINNYLQTGLTQIDFLKSFSTSTLGTSFIPSMTATSKHFFTATGYLRAYLMRSQLPTHQRLAITREHLRISKTS